MDQGQDPQPRRHRDRRHQCPAGRALRIVRQLLGVGVLESLTSGIRDQILHWNGKRWLDVQLFSEA
jgi:hypothetical protein